MTILYGIPNCDTVKKAKKWLESEGKDYQFHDFKKQGLSEEKITQWLDKVGTDTLINKRSTTWKQLSDADKADVLNSNPIPIVIQNPTLIKRPVIETETHTEVGFSADLYQSLFS